MEVWRTSICGPITRDLERVFITISSFSSQHSRSLFVGHKEANAVLAWDRKLDSILLKMKLQPLHLGVLIIGST